MVEHDGTLHDVVQVFQALLVLQIITLLQADTSYCQVQSPAVAIRTMCTSIEPAELHHVVEYKTKEKENTTPFGVLI